MILVLNLLTLSIIAGGLSLYYKYKVKKEMEEYLKEQNEIAIKTALKIREESASVRGDRSNIIYYDDDAFDAFDDNSSEIEIIRGRRHNMKAWDFDYTDTLPEYMGTFDYELPKCHDPEHPHTHRMGHDYTPSQVAEGVSDTIEDNYAEEETYELITEGEDNLDMDNNEEPYQREYENHFSFDNNSTTDHLTSSSSTEYNSDDSSNSSSDDYSSTDNSPTYDSYDSSSDDYSSSYDDYTGGDY